MNDLANELQNWMKKERGPLSLNGLCKCLGPERILALYGMRNISKCRVNINTKSLQARISEIMQHHLAYLAGQRECRLPDTSVFANRSYYEHTTLPCYMTKCLREEFPLRENALCEARFFALQHLPAQDAHETSMQSVLHELEEVYVKAINLAFSYFDTEGELQIPAVLWLNMQILLARYGFNETISRWAAQFDASSTQTELYRKWCSLNTLQGVLLGNPVEKLSETVVFPRIAGMRSRGISLREYVLNECKQHIHAAVGLDILSLLNPEEIDNTRLLNYVQYFFKEVLAKKYKDGEPRSLGCFKAVMLHLQTLFDSYQSEPYYTLLLTSLYIIQCLPQLARRPTMEEFKQLLEVVRSSSWQLPSQELDTAVLAHVRGGSFLLTMLQLLQSYGVCSFRIDLNGLDHDLGFICSRMNHDMLGRTVLLRVQEDSSATAQALTLSVKEHIRFLRTVEEVSRLRFSFEEVSHVLHVLPLRKAYSRRDLLASAKEVLDDFIELRKLLVHFQDEIHFSKDLVEALQEWQGSCAQVFPLDHPIFLNLRGKVTELLRYSLCPPTLLIQQYSRFFYMMLQKPSEIDDRSLHWQRARLFNRTLVELSSNSRAICCNGSWNEDRSAFHFSVLWVDSLSTLQTRSIEAVLRLSQSALAQDKDYAQDGEALCQEESIQELEVHPDFRAFCNDVKIKMRKMLLSSFDPVITFDGDCFYVKSLHAELAPSACRVSISECGSQLDECLRAFGERDIQNELFIDERASLYDITLGYMYEQEKCLGSGEDAEKLLMHDFYTVRFTVRERPEVYHEMRYQVRPTVQLLAWQLALLKHQLLIIA